MVYLDGQDITHPYLHPNTVVFDGDNVDGNDDVMTMTVCMYKFIFLCFTLIDQAGGLYGRILTDNVSMNYMYM